MDTKQQPASILDSSDCFVSGPYCGKSAILVSMKSPGYIDYLLKTSLTDSDRLMLASLVMFVRTGS